MSLKKIKLVNLILSPYTFTGSLKTVWRSVGPFLSDPTVLWSAKILGTAAVLTYVTSKPTEISEINEDLHHFGQLFSSNGVASKQKSPATSSQTPSLRLSAAQKTLTPGRIHLQSSSPLTILNIPHKHKALFSYIVPPPPSSFLGQKCWCGRKRLWRSTVAVVGLRATLNSA